MPVLRQEHPGYLGVMAENSTPTIQDWGDLYGAAIEFKKIGAWNWMWDSDIFGVQNPESGEVGYCCIMGRLGEHFALAVYPGTEGLEGYLKVMSSIRDPLEAFYIQKCLMVSFENRSYLQNRDLRVIEALGLKFRGQNSWPVFRNYLPGYHPWFLTGEEARYLTLAIYQAMDVSLRFKKNPKMLNSEENRYLVRVPVMEEEGLKWRDEWLEPGAFEKAEISSEPIDELRLERIKRTIPRQVGIWEADFFYLPGPVQRRKEERPYYPYMMLWVDHDSGFIFNTHVAKAQKYRKEFIEQFLQTIEDNKFLPGEI